MNFLLNNPVIALVLLAVLGLTVLTLNKIVNEVKLNNDLKIKQQSMRLVGSISKGFGKRLSLLGAQALAPIAIVIVAFVAGSNLESTPTNTEFQTVSSADDIISLFDEFQSKYNSGYQTRFFGMTDDNMEIALDGVPATNDDSQNGTGSEDYSETNNQVLGVDEMDNVLTDGKYIYTMYGNEVQITLAFTVEDGPNVLELIKTINYSNDYCSNDQFYPRGMFVDDDRFIVIGDQYQYNCDNNTGDEMEYFGYWWGANSSHIKVMVYDKTDTFNLQDEYTMNGYFTGTRKIDNNLYIVTNNYIPFYLDDVNVDDYVPYYTVDGVKTLTKYDEISYIDGTNPNAFTTFYGIDLETNEIDMEVVLGDSGFNLYVSYENIYLVGSVYYFWPLAELVDVENPVSEYKTAIMRVAIEEGTVEFHGIGYVDGHTLDQFSMDEYQGNLRVATTTGWWGADINNRVFILDEDMNVTGVVENLGNPGERIQSTRFVGDYGYVVTFLQTDPFYVINLSDPNNPVAEDELKVTGFSSYLQPLGEDYMLGIGFEADLEGRRTGIKIVIYDIRDKSNTLIFDEVVFDYESFGYAWSSATYEHKDLLVSISKGIIALPFTTWGYDDQTSEQTYNSGIVVLKFDMETGFEKILIDNQQTDKADYEFVVHEENAIWDCYVYKAKFIDDYFYTISNKYIKVSSIEDTETELYSVTLRDIE